jgi:hypothetical protein
VEVSGNHLSRALGSNNRLELDLGWRNRNDYKNNGYDDNAIKLAALYQWVWNIDGGFNCWCRWRYRNIRRDYDNRNYNNEAFVFCCR